MPNGQYLVFRAVQKICGIKVGGRVVLIYERKPASNRNNQSLDWVLGEAVFLCLAECAECAKRGYMTDSEPTSLLQALVSISVGMCTWHFILKLSPLHW